jgi:hypothetical protein
MPAMSSAQAASWNGLMDLHGHLDDGWTLVGGQLVHLLCAERGSAPQRPTDDVDTVVDVRADPNILETFTQILIDLGFTPDTSGEGLQHRWRRDEAQIDVLLPDGVGERAANRRGAGGAPTLPTPGGTQALARSESVAIVVDGRTGAVRRPNLVGALVMKAAAHIGTGDTARGRHRIDFVCLATLIAARDFRHAELTKKDRQRLRKMETACRADHRAMAVEGAQTALDRLVRAARLD